MTSKETEAMADLVESADLIVLLIGDKKAAVGKDVQASIVTALRVLAIDVGKLEKPVSDAFGGPFPEEEP